MLATCGIVFLLLEFHYVVVLAKQIYIERTFVKSALVIRVDTVLDWGVGV